MKAIDQIERINLRRRRAEGLTHAVMKTLNRYIAPDDQRDAFYALFDELNSLGVEVLTDYHRAELGLPPRGPDGWTVDEIVALERQRLELLTRPLTMPIPAWEDIMKQKPQPT